MMQEAEEEAEEEALSLLSRCYWPFGLHRRLSPSSDVRGRVNTSPPEASDAGDGKEGKSAGAAGCSMKQVGFSTQTRKWTLLYKPRYSFSEY